jgi:hypothetical protein
VQYTTVSRRLGEALLSPQKTGIISCQTSPTATRPWLEEANMIDWSQIDTVLLDMDGTLLDLHFDNFFWLQHLPKVYAQKHAISEEESSEHLHGRFHTDQGTLNWYSLDHWSEQLDMDIPALKRELQHMVSVRPLSF